MKKKTSTPKKEVQRTCRGAPRGRKVQQRLRSKNELEVARERLDEGRLIALSSDSSFGLSRNEEHDAADDGTGKEAIDTENQGLSSGLWGQKA